MEYQMHVQMIFVKMVQWFLMSIVIFYPLWA